jgi:peptidoglycan hydrolase CwlO-like protein
MAETLNGCDLLKRFIVKAKEDIKNESRTISNLEAHIRKLMSQAQPDEVMIQELKEEVEKLKQELERDQGQLEAAEDEFRESCGPLG